MRYYSEEEKRRVRDAYNEFPFPKKLSEIFKIPSYTISRWCRGIEGKSEQKFVDARGYLKKTPYTCNRTVHYSWEKRRSIVSEGELFGFKKTAEKYNLKESTLHSWKSKLKGLDLKAKPKDSEVCTAKKAYSEKIKEQARGIYKDYPFPTKIGEFLGIPPCTIVKWCKDIEGKCAIEFRGEDGKLKKTPYTAKREKGGKKPRYSLDFKKTVVESARQFGVEETAESLGIKITTLKRWMYYLPEESSAKESTDKKVDKQLSIIEDLGKRFKDRGPSKSDIELTQGVDLGFDLEADLTEIRIKLGRGVAISRQKVIRTAVALFVNTYQDMCRLVAI